MAIYHCSVKVIGRRGGRSATAAAAYRAGEKIKDERLDLTHDYSRKRDIDHKEIIAPDGAPDWVRDRARLWNEVEASEKRRDAQLAREMVVALPRELSQAENLDLVATFAKSNFVDRGMVADLTVHGVSSGNPHAHIMLTMRGIGPDSFVGKNRRWNRKGLVQEWRAGWSRHANKALERAGREERIDHRTLEAQGIERKPGVHLGPSVAAMERRGIKTVRGLRRESSQLWRGVVGRVVGLDRAAIATDPMVQLMRGISNWLSAAAEDGKRAALERFHAWQSREAERAKQEPAPDVVSPCHPGSDQREREDKQTPPRQDVRPVKDFWSEMKKLVYLYRVAATDPKKELSGGPDKLTGPVIVAGGDATVTVLYEATGRPVIFDQHSENLGRITETLRDTYPDAQIVIVPDARAGSRKLRWAWDAAKAMGGEVVMPKFTEAERAKGMTDFNDLARSRGKAAVREALASALERSPEETRELLEAEKARRVREGAEEVRQRWAEAEKARQLEKKFQEQERERQERQRQHQEHLRRIEKYMEERRRRLERERILGRGRGR